MSKYSTKLIADELPTISIYWLKQNGLLDQTGSKCPIIKMENGFGNLCQIKVWIFTIGIVVLDYYLSNQEGEHIKSEISLIKQQCNYGGHRFWFSCPQCHCKSGKLYLCGKYFVCRRCGDITYNSKNINKKSSFYIPNNCINMERRLRELHSKIRKKYYKNKLTKPFKKYLHLYNKLHSYDSLLEKISNTLG